DVRDYYIKERNDYIGGTLVIKAVTNDKVNTEIKGDVNYDETVSILDATLIQKHLAKMETLDYDKLENADYNGDGTVDIKDTTAIQKRLANIS
ncbi:MAG: dockerin type I repeat-containing protein, partial [Ruminococcus sp.]|nr:dockerin type I repeat-containing protein [Ruminococcus sp.]